MLRVSALYRYPLKSAAGESCAELPLDRFGVEGDRRWMIATPAGQPITQRERPALALLEAHLDPSGLALTWRAEPGGSRTVEAPGADAKPIDVNIWGQRCRLRRADDGSARWLADRLGLDLVLAFMPEDAVRPVNPRYATAGDQTALTDGFPLHLIGSGSMDDLNGRLVEPVNVRRFRPNVYVEGAAAFEEDTWSVIRVGGETFRVVKPCPRCSVTTVDPDAGTTGKEPLRTLASYRRRDGGVMFGQNVIHDGRGTIRVGDSVEVVSRRDAPAG